MARKVSLIDSEFGEEVSHWYHATIDICESHTIIYPFHNSFVDRICFVASLNRIDIVNNKIIVWYKTPFPFYFIIGG